MPRLSLTLDEQTLQRIRARAAGLGTTPSNLVREYLEAFARTESVRALAFQTLLNTPPPEYRGESEWQAEDSAGTATAIEAERLLRVVR